MPDPTINPKQRALREAVAAYSEKTGVNAATISLVTEKFIGLVAARWEHICDAALAEESEGIVKVAFGLVLDMSHKVPVGTLQMSFSIRTKDDCEFHVDDPNQPALPFAEAVRIASRTPEAAQRISRRGPRLASGAANSLPSLCVPPLPAGAEQRESRHLTRLQAGQVNASVPLGTSQPSGPPFAQEAESPQQRAARTRAANRAARQTRQPAATT